ncbi:MAG: hypothetical protein U0228_24215 [Myxococcaceae bacterium]
MRCRWRTRRSGDSASGAKPSNITSNNARSTSIGSTLPVARRRRTSRQVMPTKRS